MDKIDSTLFDSILEDIEPNNKPINIIGQMAFENVAILVKRHFTDDFCELIINSIGPKTDLRKVAILVDVLIWSTPDNGAKLEKLTEDWLYSDNLNKIKCLLFRHEWLPNPESWEIDSKNIMQIEPKLESIVNYYNEELTYSMQTGFRRIDKLNSAIDNYSLKE